MEHPPIALMPGFWKVENVKPFRWIITRQFRCHGISNEQIEVTVAVKIGQRGSHAYGVFIKACSLGDILEIGALSRTTLVFEQPNLAPARGQKERLPTGIIKINKHCSCDEPMLFRVSRDLIQGRQRHPGEFKISQIVQQRVALISPLQGIGQKNVRQTIVVIVSGRRGVAHGKHPFGQMGNAMVNSGQRVRPWSRLWRCLVQTQTAEQGLPAQDKSP